MKDGKMEVKAILFDLDGTILDITERDAFARCKALNELGHNVSLGEVKQNYRFGIGRLGLVKNLGIELTEEEEECGKKEGEHIFRKRSELGMHSET